MKLIDNAFRAAGAAALALGLTAAGQAQAAGAGPEVIDHHFHHEGMFGTFDADQLKRGWQIYSEICASCHSLKYLSYRDLGDPNGPAFSAEDVKAIAAGFDIDDIDEDGEPTTRPGRPADKVKSPYANEEQAKAANGGAIPPDLSLMTKARAGCHGIWVQLAKGACGPEYVYSLMLGYKDEPPEGFDPGDLTYNQYFPGHKIAMGQQLYGDYDYLDGSTGTMEQQAEDIAAFLTWTAEPKLVERKQAGLRNILFLTLFAALLWYSNRRLWAPVKKGGGW